MRKTILWILFLVFLLGIAWFIWSGIAREPQIEDKFTPAPQEVKPIEPIIPYNGGKG